jgi:hypothetical protein
MLVMFAQSFLRGLGLVLFLVNTLTNLSSLPDHLIEHIRGLGHLGGVEHQVDVVVLEETVG